MIEERKSSAAPSLPTQPQDWIKESQRQPPRVDPFEKLFEQLKEVHQDNHSTQLSIQLINAHVDELSRKDTKVEMKDKKLKEVKDIEQEEKKELQHLVELLKKPIVWSQKMPFIEPEKKPFVLGQKPLAAEKAIAPVPLVQPKLHKVEVVRE